MLNLRPLSIFYKFLNFNKNHPKLSLFTEGYPLNKFNMKKKKLPIIPREAFEKKNTKELIGYLKNLQKCEESFSASDMDVNLDLIEDNCIYFKETDKWKTAFVIVKSILANREHIKR
jgi:hypothetical protein